jgi:hypothetical protein
MWKKLYPQFRRIVCYNESNNEQIKYLRSQNQVQLIDQKQINILDLWKFSSAGWKLCPPRIDLNCHEIFCDNDLILLKPCKIIDNFLLKNTVFACDGLQRNFGNFDSYVPAGIKLNTGIFGIPPGFDLKTKLIKIQAKVQNKGWNDIFDEQGFIATVFSKEPGCVIIPINEIYNCVNDFKMASGLHFCGLNNGNTTQWMTFRKTKLPLL